MFSFFRLNYNNPLYIDYIYMCNINLACFWPSQCLNSKYDGAQCRRSLLQFYSLFRNICWLWFSAFSRFFLLFFDLNNSFVFNRIIDTRVQICQINVVRYIILLRGVNVNAGRRDRAVAQHLEWRACVKVSQETMHNNNRNCKHYSHLGNVRQVRPPVKSCTGHKAGTMENVLV